MHFTYLQDDWRVNNRLTLNLGLRYEYATPYWEAHNVLSNFDPVTNSMLHAKDGSIYDRALVDPDRNNFGPRLGFAYTVAPGTVIRGGYGISYVHFNRAGGGDLLPINGPQVVNAVVNQTDPPRPTSYDAAGVSGWTCRPVTVQSAGREHHLHARDYHSSQVQSWYISVQREVVRNMLVDVAYVGNRADDLMLFANYNQARPNNAAGTIPLQDAPSDSELLATSPMRSTAASRATRRCRRRSNWRVSRDVTLLNSLTLSDTKDNGARSLENAERQLPGAAGLPQPRRRLRALGLPPAVQQHDKLRVDAAVRSRASAGEATCRAARRASSADGSLPASTRCSPASR